MNSRLIRLGLSILGVGGVGVTSYLAIKCNEKAKDIPKANKKEKFVAWLPAIISGAITSGCILIPNHLADKEIAVLTAGCGYLAAKHDKVEKVIKEKLGQKTLTDIRAEANKELAKDKKRGEKSTIEWTGHGTEHFVETELGREFFCSREHVDWAFKMLNQMFKNGKDVSMNVLYELLGLKKIRQGYEFGWPNESDYDFGYSLDEPIHHEIMAGEDEEGELMYWIDIRHTPPIYGYLEV